MGFARVFSPVILVSLLLLSALVPGDAVGTPRQNVRLSARGTAASAKDAPVSELGIPPGDVQLKLDDGSYDFALGVVDDSGEIANQAVYLNYFHLDPDQLPLTLDSVSVLFPLTDQFGSTGLRDRMTFEMLVYLDPDGTALPADAVEVARVPFDLAPSDTDFQTVALTEAVTVTRGSVWVGFTNFYSSVSNEAIYPAALDATTNLGASYAFHNMSPGDHFDGRDLASAESQLVVEGNWLIRANYQTGGEVTLCWSQGTGGDNPAPTNLSPCGGTKADAVESPRGALMGYNVYRSTQPNVQPSASNYFTSVPPGMTTVSSSVSSSGTFFVVTAVYDTGMSGPSNEVGFKPATIASVAFKKGGVKTTGTGFTSSVQVFLDGIPFVSPAKVKGGTKVNQKGNLLSGQSVSAYLKANGNTARVTILNNDGTTSAANLVK